jgi:electron transfer flavoprotein alpha subunit
MSGIWLFAERRDLTLELLTIGRRLASQTGAKLTIIVPDEGDQTDAYVSCGADEILLLSLLSESMPLEGWIPVIADEAKHADPDIILIAATARGKVMAARLAARLETGLCSNCVALREEDGGTIIMERLVYGGVALQQVICTGRPVMATIPPRTFEQAPADHSRKGNIRKLSPPLSDTVRILERKTKERSKQDITAAKTVVCVGRGMDKRDDLTLARQLADLLGGEVGCTRPISEELHWLPNDLCIGLSGVQVKPDLYIGIGVSGQIQHITGIRGARVICAINKDEKAPVFQAADLGIVGDLYSVLPKLIEEIKRMTGR